MTSLWILLLPAVGVFAGGVVVGHILGRSSAESPSGFDDGYNTALHALGWIAGYAGPPPSRQERRSAWRASWRRSR